MKLLGQICPHCNKRYWRPDNSANMCHRCYYGCERGGMPPRPPDLYPLAALSDKQLLDLMRITEQREAVDRYIQTLEKNGTST